MKKTIIYALIIVLLVSTVVVFGSKGFKKENSIQAAVVNNISVKVQKAQLTEKTSGLTYKADIEPYEEAVISSKISGKVISVLFENGKVVAPGEALVILDSQDLNNQLKLAENQLSAAQISMRKVDINLANSKRDYDRTKALYDTGAVSQASIENADTVLKIAEADADCAKANIETLKLNISILKDSLANTVIKAPMGGIVDEKGVSVGQFVSPVAALAKVKDISSVYAVIHVEQENISKLKTGQKALVKLDGNSDAAFEGSIVSIDLSADPSARVFKCKIKLNNEKQQLRPGIFAKAEVVNDKKVMVVTVPIEAMAGNEGNYYAFVNENGVARKRTVLIGGIVKNMIEILSGVQAGESVIYTNVSTLQDGDKITVVAE
jgi:RND family efflux transporter MFP subunit